MSNTQRISDEARTCQVITEQYSAVESLKRKEKLYRRVGILSLFLGLLFVAVFLTPLLFDWSYSLLLWFLVPAGIFIAIGLSEWHMSEAFDRKAVDTQAKLRGSLHHLFNGLERKLKRAGKDEPCRIEGVVYSQIAGMLQYWDPDVYNTLWGLKNLELESEWPNLLAAMQEQSDVIVKLRRILFVIENAQVDLKGTILNPTTNQEERLLAVTGFNINDSLARELRRELLTLGDTLSDRYGELITSPDYADTTLVTEQFVAGG